jgi:hypothetical protein
MLCQFCQVKFAFYLKYCRQCGNKLVKETSIKANTSKMASSTVGAIVGKSKTEYSTSPLTQEMGNPANSLAEVLQNIMTEFPSLQTNRMSKIFSPIYSSYSLYPGMSRTEQMRTTLREFDMSELQEIEENSSILSTLEANTHKVNKTQEKQGTQTIEFKRPSAHLGETQPFSSPSNQSIAPSKISKTKYVLDSDRLHSTRSLPTKLYLPSSEKMVKLKTSTLSNLSKDNSLAGNFRQTLSNLWTKMRDLAENLSVNFSIRKNA